MPSISCENCETEMTEVLALCDSPSENTDAEVICNHCGQPSGTTVATAAEVFDL